MWHNFNTQCILLVFIASTVVQTKLYGCYLFKSKSSKTLSYIALKPRWVNQNAHNHMVKCDPQKAKYVLVAWCQVIRKIWPFTYKLGQKLGQMANYTKSKLGPNIQLITDRSMWMVFSLCCAHKPLNNHSLTYDSDEVLAV